nr:hypothetical protein BgiMline_011762 [Biomphalaria glabrata]
MTEDVLTFASYSRSYAHLLINQQRPVKTVYLMYNTLLNEPKQDLKNHLLAVAYQPPTADNASVKADKSRRTRPRKDGHLTFRINACLTYTPN